MKKIKSLFCIALLSIFLVGNVFAANSGGGFFGFFESAYQAVVSMLGGGDCEGKQCTSCKPKEEGGSGDCRPTN